MTNLAEHFEQLGAPERVGYAFAITTKALHADYGGNEEGLLEAVGKIDVPYEYAIFHDHMTDCYLVERPNARGHYHHRGTGVMRKVA